MTLTGLDKFKKDNVMCEVPPVADDKGEFTEVQVLEEGNAFDPDRFLDQFEKHQPSPRRECPLCLVPLKYGSVKQRNGNIFKYYRCPTTSYHQVSRKTSKCCITCPADEVDQYLELARKQIHPRYLELDMISFQCKCHKPLVLSTSHSFSNPNRLYLKCAKRDCEFFQWIDEEPRGMAEDIMIHGYCEP